jgi:hypothetical protein
MAKRVSEIDLDPGRLTKKEILSLLDAGRSMRIQCSFCGQGWINCINYGPLKNILWCYECDTVYPNLDSIQNIAKYPEKGISSLRHELQKNGLTNEEFEICEGYILTYSEDFWKNKA